jgi:predicted N-acetyltransferase YhbS
MSKLRVNYDFGNAFGLLDNGRLDLVTDYLSEIQFSESQIDDVRVQLHSMTAGRPVALLIEIEVEDSLQGNGHGREILTGFIRQSKDAGAKAIFLVCDLDRFQRPGFKLSDFYRKSGFVELGSLFDELGAMVKFL